jgi:hypothetical protein
VERDAVVDELAIRRVLAEYCHLVDDTRWDDLAELFTADAAFTFGKYGATGRDELVAWLVGTDRAGIRGKHLTTNSVIDLDGDVAAAVSDFAFLAFDDGRLVVSLAGRYHDELHRVDGRWQIHRRDAVQLRERQSPSGAIRER